MIDSVVKTICKAYGIDKILEHYTLNELEKEMLPYYKFVTDISFYPNVQLWVHLIQKHVHEEKVITLLETMIMSQGAVTFSDK